IRIVMHRVRDGWGVQEIDFGAVTRCEDGTRLGGGTGLFFFGRQHLRDRNGFDLDLASIFEALHIHGRIGPRGGSGTLQDTLPALTQDEKAQTCTSKEQTWSVKRRSPALDAACCAPHAAGLDSVVSLTMQVKGSVEYISRSLERGPASHPGSTGQTRLYIGKT